MRTNTTLADKVKECLSKRSPQAAEQWSQHYQSHVTGGFNTEVTAVNSYLRMQLGLLDCPTISERECLVDNITEKDWLRNFNKYVAPTIVEHGLPDWK